MLKVEAIEVEYQSKWLFPLNDVSSKRYLLIWTLRGNLHTQIAKLTVKLKFLIVWIEMPDVRVVTEMSKTVIS